MAEKQTRKYESSKIYCVKSEQDKKYVIGATTKTLAQRMASYKDSYKKWLAKESKYYDVVFEILKYSDAKIQLLEVCNLKNKDELNSKLVEYYERYKQFNIQPVKKEREYKEDAKKAGRPKKEVDEEKPKEKKKLGRPKKEKIEEPKEKKPIGRPKKQLIIEPLEEIKEEEIKEEEIKEEEVVRELIITKVEEIPLFLRQAIIV
jgi:hypothetical protein